MKRWRLEAIHWRLNGSMRRGNITFYVYAPSKAEAEKKLQAASPTVRVLSAAKAAGRWDERLGQLITDEPVTIFENWTKARP